MMIVSDTTLAKQSLMRCYAKQMNNHSSHLKGWGALMEFDHDI